MKIVFSITHFDIKEKESTIKHVFLLAKHFVKKNKVAISTGKFRLHKDKLFEKIYINKKKINVYRTPLFHVKQIKCLNLGFIFGGITELIAHTKNIISASKDLHGVDIIHTFVSAPLLFLRVIIAKKVTNAKTIVTLKGYSRYKYIGSQKFSKILNFADAITVHSKQHKKLLSKNKIPDHKISVIPPFIDTNYFRPIKINKKIKQIKEKLIVKTRLKNPKIVLYYGHIYKEKGIDYIIKAAKTETENILYVIISSGLGHHEEYLKKAKRIKHLLMFKNKDEIINYIIIADLILLPYVNLLSTENIPSCLLESMACKKPILTTRQKEFTDYFSDKELIFIQDNENLRHEIKKALQHKKLSIIAKNAYLKSKKYSVDNVIKQYDKLYEKMFSTKH